MGVRGSGRAAAAVGFAVLLAACSGGDAEPVPTATATVTATAPATASGPVTAEPSGGASAPPVSGTGCDPNDATVPAGARTGTGPDLDLDGDPDTLWLADVAGKRTLGVRTATGATFSTTFDSAAPQAARALGARLGDDVAIVLLDTGRSVSLYTVVNCEIVPTANAQGEQYTFDKGFTGFGTGVGCVDLGAGLQLVGLLADNDGSDRYTVHRTAIGLTDFGRRAANGARTTVVTGAPRDDPAVVSAQSVTCGDRSGDVTEPSP